MQQLTVKAGCAMPLAMRCFALLRLCACALLLAPVACQRAPTKQSHVALWVISANGTPRGWMIGTIHALPPGTPWETPAIAAATTLADRLVMEIGEPISPDIAGKALARLAMTPGLPPPSARLDRADQTTLTAAYRRLGLNDDQFHNEKTWAVALQISALAVQKAGAAAEVGVEPQLRARMAGKPVSGLETIDSQFAAFDRLPDQAQKRLLSAVAREAIAPANDEADTLAMWLNGDEQGLAKLAYSDFLADPLLHDALLTARNHAWIGQIDALLREGKRPFIAVGAAHVAGQDGLTSLLRARGWTVTRIS